MGTGADDRDGAGGWTLPVRLSSGSHRFNLRVDGARWVVPEGFSAGAGWIRRGGRLS